MNGWSTRRLRAAAITFLALAVVFVAVALAAELVLSRGQTRIALEFMLIASLVIGIQVYVGNSGVLSFGHVAFYGLAAYTAALAAMSPEQKTRFQLELPGWLMDMEAPLLLAVALAVVAVVIFAAFTGVPIARMQPSVVPMATLVLLVVVHSVINVSATWTRGPIGLASVPDLVDVWTVLATSLLVTAAALVYRASPWGLKLQAIREDPVAAESLGIPVARIRFAGWMVSAVLTAVAGAVWALNSLAFNPDRFFFTETFALLTMLVIGGFGSVTGAVVGAAIVSMVSELLRGLEGGFSVGPLTVGELPGIVQLATAVLILLVLVWRPGGIFGNKEAGDLLWRQKQ